MNATSVLVLIMVLSFAADRVARAIMLTLRLIPAWTRRFPDPLNFTKDQELERARARRRLDIAYTLVVGAIATAAIYAFPDLHIIRMLTRADVPAAIDIAVTVIVVMGGSELLAKIVQLSGLGDAAMAPTAQAASGSGRSDPIEISGRLIVEQEQVTFRA